MYIRCLRKGSVSLVGLKAIIGGGVMAADERL